MTLFTAEHYQSLRALGLTWSFRIKAICPGERVGVCNVVDANTLAFVLSCEGPSEADALCGAVEYSERWAAEKQRAATERRRLLAKTKRLERRLVATKETTNVASSD